MQSFPRGAPRLSPHRACAQRPSAMSRTRGRGMRGYVRTDGHSTRGVPKTKPSASAARAVNSFTRRPRICTFRDAHTLRSPCSRRSRRCLYEIFPPKFLRLQARTRSRKAPRSYIRFFSHFRSKAILSSIKPALHNIRRDAAYVRSQKGTPRVPQRAQCAPQKTLFEFSVNPSTTLCREPSPHDALSPQKFHR